MESTTPGPALGYDQITETAAWLAERAAAPNLAIVLGSGLGPLADDLEGATSFPYDAIPHFPTSTVAGHEGRLVFGRAGGRAIVAMQGRFHAYEGWRLDQVVFPMRVFRRMGCRALFVTNSAGGINADFAPGDLMLIRDHVNLTGRSPLAGPNDPRIGPRFPDMSRPYDIELWREALKRARAIGEPLRTGVYCGVLGPSYETPAEIRMMRTFGCDAVGMSTVPEVIAANHCGMRVLGVSCITNYAAGVSDDPLTHAEVTETAAGARARFSALLLDLIENLSLPRNDA